MTGAQQLPRNTKPHSTIRREPLRETERASLEKFARLCEDLVSGNQPGGPVVYFADPTLDLFIPRSLNVVVYRIDGGQKFLGQSNTFLWTKRMGFLRKFVN